MALTLEVLPNARDRGNRSWPIGIAGNTKPGGPAAAQVESHSEHQCTRCRFAVRGASKQLFAARADRAAPWP